VACTLTSNGLELIDHQQTLDALETYCKQKFAEGAVPKLNVYMKVECGNG
jgi:hypothetical protein